MERWYRPDPWNMTAEERYAVAEAFSQEQADQTNYFLNSVGFWSLRSRKPAGEPDHVSIDRMTGKVRSRYWYTPKGVYRQSDHWGSDVASCSWYIHGRQYPAEGVVHGNLETAFIRWEDLKAKGMIGRRDTGEYFLIGFEFEK